MAAYRKISVTFWADSFIQSLTPEGKYFYLYLMTNTRTTQCGIYEITLSQMCFETGYNQETINKLLTMMEKTGRVKYSKNTKEIALKNWPKYNESDSPKVKACVEKELKSVKNRVLIEYLYSMDTETQETKAKEETKEEEQAETETAEAVMWPTFDDFWDRYGKKVGKPKSIELWKKISQGAREKIMQHLEIYTQKEKQFRKDPERYLRHQVWNDEIVLTAQGNGTRIIDKREQGLNSLKENFAKRVVARNSGESV